jgi:hypothetical protein
MSNWQQLKNFGTNDKGDVINRVGDKETNEKMSLGGRFLY